MGVGKKTRGLKTHRWVWALGAATVVGLATALFIWGEQFATQDADFALKRLQADLGPDLGPLPRRKDPPFPAHANACHPRAQRALASALASGGQNLSANEWEDVLILDPDCTPAMRLAVQWAAHSGQLPSLFSRLIVRAEREPLSAAAQLGAAMFSDYAGRSGDMHAFLLRAQTLRADLPLLAATWANHLRHHATTLEWSQVLAHWQSELALREDPETLAHLIAFYADVPDRLSALAACNRFYAAAPQFAGSHPARTCLKVAVELNDATAVDVYKQRFASTGESPDCQERWITYFGLLAGHKQARSQAAQQSSPCPQVFPWLRGVALLEQGHTAVAAAALQNLKDTPAWVAATALALRGQRQAAVAHLQAADPDPGTLAHALLPLLQHDLVEAPALLSLFNQPRPQSDGAHHAEAACGYLQRNLIEAAQTALAKAVALAPEDPFVAACQLRWFTSQNDLASAQRVAARASQLRPLPGPLLAELGHLHANQDMCAEAVDVLERARIKAPLHPTLYADLVRCLRRLGRNDEADRWAMATGDDPGPWLWLGGASAAVALAGVAVLLVRGRRKRRQRLAA